MTDPAQISPDGGAVLEAISIPETASLREALHKLERTGTEVVCICDGDGRLIGVLSNGDARAAALKNISLESPITDAMNREFVAMPQRSSRERVLKMLDSRIKAIPIIDSSGRLVDFVAAGLRYTHPQGREIYARARAPARLSLAGGGTDFTSYFMDHGGVSLTTTVLCHARAMLRRRDDSRIIIQSHDLGRRIEAENLQALTYNGSIDLLKAGITVMQPSFGFELHVASDMMPGSGLGGSAALLAAVIGCFNEFRDEKLDLYEISEHAFEAERMELSVSGGWQDQYATVFGGFNFLEFSSEHNVVTPLRLQTSTLQEMEERFLLCYTGIEHKGQQIQGRHKNRHVDDPERISFASELKDIALDMRSKLLRGNLEGFGQALGDTWSLKKRYESAVTSEALDAVYDVAIQAGAEGGRLLGTGGGGFYLFFTKPFRRYDVIRALTDRGLTVGPVAFDALGLQSWTSRGNEEFSE
ncbi:MAG TPA: sugar kinase [Rhodospirillaceae bacterium]|nr:sugar kinase [Rhodospirillaceae bacterium]